MQALAMKTAEQCGATLILANDPDTDRLAVAERDPISNDWDIFTGNEIGSLMGWWLFKNYKEKHPNMDGKWPVPAVCIDALPFLMCRVQGSYDS